MAVKKIRVANFKSFKDIEVELGNFNLLIGANASGKSNFVEIFRFLRDTTRHGLDNAIALQGGVEYFRNRLLPTAKKFSAQVVYQPNDRQWHVQLITKNLSSQARPIARHFGEASYNFSLRFDRNEANYQVIEDRLVQQVEYFEVQPNQPFDEQLPQAEVSRAETIFSVVDGKPEHRIVEQEGSLKYSDVFAISPDDFSLLAQGKLSPKQAFLESSLFDLMDPFDKTFHQLPIYDFDPKLARRGAPIAGKLNLEEDGGNLALALKRIFDNPDQKRMFMNLATYALPFIEDLQVEQFPDRSLLLNLQEKYQRQLKIPASFMSAGTIHIIALIVALYFEKTPLLIIEEPERNIHPFLISKVMHMFADAAQHKQIIVTTHNPEMVKYADVSHLLLAHRDENGFSTISRPGDKEEVKTFLQNEIGLEELFVQDLLRL